MKTEVTTKGSVTLFYHCKALLQEKVGTLAKVRDQDIGRLIGRDPANVSGWKRGEFRLASVNAYLALSKGLEVSIDSLTQIATEINTPEVYRKYKVAIDKAVRNNS